MTSFTELNLAWNELGFKGASALSNCLQYWPNLQRLDVSGKAMDVGGKVCLTTNIGSDGAIELTKELHHCIQLKYLNMADNAIKREHMRAIIKNLSRCI